VAPLRRLSSGLQIAAENGAAIRILRDQHSIFNEPFEGFAFTRFDGSTITV
jgi:hypothetical protein